MVVELVVMPPAQQGEPVDIAAPVVGGPGIEVMGFASSRWGVALHAAAVAGDESSPLRVGGGAVASPVPEWVAVPGEEDAEQVGVAAESFELGDGDRTDTGDLAPTIGSLAGENPGLGDDHDLVASGDPSGRGGRTGRFGTGSGSIGTDAQQ